MALVLVVANRTATTAALSEAVRNRAAHGDATFHLVVPSHPHGLHRVVDPQDVDRSEAQSALAEALPVLSDAAGAEVTGEVGDPEPWSAIRAAGTLRGAGEIIISTLRGRVSRWLRLDLVSRARGLGLPVPHVEAEVPASVA